MKRTMAKKAGTTKASGATSASPSVTSRLTLEFLLSKPKDVPALSDELLARIATLQNWTPSTLSRSVRLSDFPSLQQQQVYCASGKRKKIGTVIGDGVRCQCCDNTFSPTDFTVHLGKSKATPWRAIYELSSNKSLEDLRAEILNSNDKWLKQYAARTGLSPLSTPPNARTSTLRLKAKATNSATVTSTASSSSSSSPPSAIASTIIGTHRSRHISTPITVRHSDNSPSSSTLSSTSSSSPSSSTSKHRVTKVVTLTPSSNAIFGTSSHASTTTTTLIPTKIKLESGHNRHHRDRDDDYERSRRSNDRRDDYNHADLFGGEKVGSKRHSPSAMAVPPSKRARFDATPPMAPIAADEDDISLLLSLASSIDLEPSSSHHHHHHHHHHHNHQHHHSASDNTRPKFDPEAQSAIEIFYSQVLGGVPPSPTLDLVPGMSVGLASLYSLVKHHGGYLQACNKGRWPLILRQLGCSDSSPTILTAVHQVYLMYLYPVELYCPDGQPIALNDMDAVTLSQWQANEPCFTKGVSRYHEEPFFQCRRCGVWESGTTWQGGAAFYCSVCICVQQRLNIMMLQLQQQALPQPLSSMPTATTQALNPIALPMGATAAPFVAPLPSVATPFVQASPVPSSSTDPPSATLLRELSPPTGAVAALSASKTKQLVCPKCRCKTRYDPALALNNFHQCSQCNTEFCCVCANKTEFGSRHFMCPWGVLDIVFDRSTSRIEVTNPHLLPQAWNSFVLFDSHTNRVLISGMAADELDPMAATTNFEFVRERLAPEQALCLVDSASGLVHKIATSELEWPFRQVQQGATDFASEIAASAAASVSATPMAAVGAVAAAAAASSPPFLATPPSTEQERFATFGMALAPISEVEQLITTSPFASPATPLSSRPLFEPSPNPAAITTAAITDAPLAQELSVAATAATTVAATAATTAAARDDSAIALPTRAAPAPETLIPAPALEAPATIQPAPIGAPTPDVPPTVVAPAPRSSATSDVDLLAQLDVLSVADWLKRIGLEALITEFVKLEIDGRALALLSVNALRKALSVTTRDAIILDGERTRLIKNLRDGGSVS